MLTYWRIGALAHAAFFMATALLFVTPANACELICIKTENRYSGDLGGLAGADAKCAAEYPGFKFSRSASLVEGYAVSKSYGVPGITGGYTWGIQPPYTNILDGGGNFRFFGTAWAGGVINNCSDWTSTSNVIPGNAMGRQGSSTQLYVDIATCNHTLSLICCNM
jgi:hypothetical protein